jgi:hypothetical protein
MTTQKEDNNQKPQRFPGLEKPVYELDKTAEQINQLVAGRSNYRSPQS